MESSLTQPTEELIIEGMSHFPNTMHHAIDLNSGLLPPALFLYGIACAFVQDEYTDRPWQIFPDKF